MIDEKLKKRMNTMELLEQLQRFEPQNEQEARDCAEIISLLENEQDLYTRENPYYHLTASAWVVNKERNKVLMAYHNLYDSWAWLGGHADGDRNLLHTAIREVKEESGLTNVNAISEDIYSVEILTVSGHEKKGKYVSSHLHLNVTYLLEADDCESLHNKPDENSDVAWFTMEDAVKASNEEWFKQRIYSKLNNKLLRNTHG